MDLGSPHLVATIVDRVLHVRIDRVERRNAMTQAMYRGVKRAAIRADGDPDIDVMCLTGTGPVFASGGDMGGGNDPVDPTLAVEHDPTDNFPFRHLERCRPCADLDHDLRDLQRLCRESPRPCLPEEARERIERLLRGED